MSVKTIYIGKEYKTNQSQYLAEPQCVYRDPSQHQPLEKTVSDTYSTFTAQQLLTNKKQNIHC